MVARRARVIKTALLVPFALVCAGAPVAAEGDVVVASTAQIAAVDDALRSYLLVSDEVWTGPPDASQEGAGSGAGWTEWHSLNSRVRDAMADVGAPVVSATSTADVIVVTPRGDRALTVRAEISTVFAYGTAGSDGSPSGVWTDEHELVVDVSGATPVVLTDRVVDPPADDTPGTPSGDAPVPSSADR
ncbi:hypothetical protein [Cellulomonas sp. P22]|uniref:hypothetical protein n=1 Tax=Cellulomonas sp. P22 TaxID=3373189 RepID=UPI0037BEEA4D